MGGTCQPKKEQKKTPRAFFAVKVDVSIGLVREIVHLKAYNLKLLPSTYLMVIQPIENFLLSLEVG